MKYSIKYLPCLRCARITVAVFIPAKCKTLNHGDLTCKRCEAPHVLVIKSVDGFAWALYDRDTRRYPADHYDDNDFPIVKFPDAPLSSPEPDLPFPDRGPIIIFKRRRLSPHEVKTVWLNSNRRCVHCSKAWKLKDRSLRGWHVDHTIPNSGGGRDTECIENFRVACAKCNLKRGRGYTSRTVESALAQLFK